VVANSEILQKKWMEENVSRNGDLSKFSRTAAGVLERARSAFAGRAADPGVKPFLRPIFSLLGRGASRPDWLREILAAQITKLKPDVLVNISMGYIDPGFISSMKPHVRLMMGQFPEQLPPEYYKSYDVYLSSLPNLVDRGIKFGIPGHLLKLGFEPRILNQLREEGKPIPVSSMANLGYCFEDRIPLFEYLCQRLPLEIRGYGAEELAGHPVVLKHHKKEVWGLQMYQTVKNSMITVNRHADAGKVGDFANNLRMFETTGVGTLLVTDWKENLPDYFKAGKEALAYRTPEECCELVKYYLEHEEERKALAAAGQARTLESHTYYSRMQDLAGIVKEHLR